MKCNSSLFLALALILFLTPSAFGWYDNSWNYKTEVTVSSTTRPYQLSLNVSNSTGTNNATWVFCNGNCNSNFSDLRFTLNDFTPIPYWIENATGINSTTALVWVNLTTTGTIQMYYGNTGASPYSDGNNTFPIFDHFTEASLNSSKWDAGGTGSASLANSNITILDRYYIRSKSQYSSGYSMRARVRMGTDADDHIFVGFMATTSYDMTKMNVLKYDIPDTALYCLGGHDSVGYKEYEFIGYSKTAWQIFEYKRGGTADSCRLTNDSNLNFNGDVFSPNRYSTHTRYLMAQAWTSDMILDWIFMANYSLTPPVWGTWGAEISGHVTYEPPAPIAITRTNGTDWTNYTWIAGTGNVTDQYNLCINFVCSNISASYNYSNTTLSPHQWNNISVKAINTSNNTMNTTEITSGYQNPNTAPVLSVIGNKKIYQDKTLNIQLSATDNDGDTTPTWYRFEAENDSNWREVPGWNVAKEYTGLDYSNTYIVYTDWTYDPFTFDFNGTQFNLSYIQTTVGGIMNWSFDGNSNNSIDQYYTSSVSYQYHNNSTNTDVGSHQINFYKTGTKNGSSSGTQVYLDFVDVNVSGWYSTNATKGTFDNATGLFTWTPTIADVGNYTWYFNYTDGWGGTDNETINVTVKANRLLNVSLYNTGWQTILVNDSQTFLSLDTLLDPTYLAIWNGSAQAWEKYKSGWLYRSDQVVSSDNAVYALVSENKTKELNISHSFNYTFYTGQNLIGFPENMTMLELMNVVNDGGGCDYVDEESYINPITQYQYTYTCDVNRSVELSNVSTSYTQYGGGSSIVDGMYFDGVDDMLVIPISAAQFSSSPVGTISVWLNHTNRDGIIDSIFNFNSKPSIAVWPNGLYITWNDATGFPVLDEYTNYYPLSSDTWYNIVFAWNNSSSTYSLYIDGVSVENSTTMSVPAMSNGAKEIGGFYGVNHYLGYMDNFQIYNRDLNAAEVSTNYALGQNEYPSNSSGLIWYWNNNASIQVEEGRGAWVNAVQNVTLLNVLG